MRILWGKLIYSHIIPRYGKLVSIDFPMHGNIFSQFIEKKWEYPYLSYSWIFRDFFCEDSPQNNFLNFLTSKNIFITLQYSGVILGIFLKQTFVECSSNILETLLRDYWNLPKDQHLLLSNHTLLTQKQLFHGELLKKSFLLKCSLNVPWMSRALQRLENTQ